MKEVFWVWWVWRLRLQTIPRFKEKASNNNRPEVGGCLLSSLNLGKLSIVPGKLSIDLVNEFDLAEIKLEVDSLPGTILSPRKVFKTFRAQRHP